MTPEEERNLLAIAEEILQAIERMDAKLCEAIAIRDRTFAHAAEVRLSGT
jgi:hypothetical protein